MPFPSRILIIEDEELLAENLKALLERYTADVRIAGDGGSAIELLRLFTPDLVVTDHALPGIDGLRAYAEISRATSRRPACVMITAFVTDLLHERAQRVGITEILCKPFSFAELRQAISLTLEDNLAPRSANRRLKERRTKQTTTVMANRRIQLSRRAPAAASETA